MSMLLNAMGSPNPASDAAAAASSRAGGLGIIDAIANEAATGAGMPQTGAGIMKPPVEQNTLQKMLMLQMMGYGQGQKPPHVPAPMPISPAGNIFSQVRGSGGIAIPPGMIPPMPQLGNNPSSLQLMPGNIFRQAFGGGF